MLDKVVRDLFRGKDRSKQRPTGPARASAKPRRPNFALEVLEPRLLLSADPVVSLNTNTGVLTAQLTDTADTAVVALNHVATPSGVAADGGLIIDLTVNGALQQFGDADHGVTSIVLQGLGGNDDFTLVEALPIEVTIDGGADTDTIHGRALGTEWTIDGAGSGSANGITSFTGIESLVGGASGRDQFKLAPGGSMDQLDGGGGAALDVLIGPDIANTWTLSDANAGTVNLTTHFAGIESLTGGMAADNFIVGPNGSLSGLLDGGLLNSNDPAVDSLDLSARTSVVTVDLALAEVSGVIAHFSRIGSITGSNAPGNDTLRGPGEPGDEVAWTITGPDAGEVGGTAFSGFENLTGRSSTSDAFFFDEFGALSGLLDGGNGAGTADGLEVWASSTLNTVFTPSGADAAGTVTIEGRTIDYAGLDGDAVLSGSPDELVIRGSVFADNIVLEDAGVGTMKVTFVGLNFFDGIGFNTSFTFANPGTSLTILGGLGGDHITVQSVDENFAADLLLYGNKDGAPAPEPDAAHDVVTFAGDTFTRGGYLEAFADDIAVADGVTVSTLADQNDLATGNDIVFRARRIGTTELENLLPSGYIPKSVSITIGADAVLTAGSIYLVAQAEDRDIATQLGLTTLESQFFVAPGMNLLNDLTALPIKVLIKSSSSQVTIGDRAKVLADDVIGIYSTAAADASAAAASQLVSLGYSQATASATIDVHSGALIEGGGAVNLTSDASAVAKMSTETSREEQGSVPGKKSAAFAASIAVSFADVVSKSTVAEGATVHGGRTVNVRSLGDIESEAEAESGLFADGSAAIALGLQFSTADIQTTLSGHVQADMNTPGGEVVKFEFDPTVAASDYTASQSTTRLKNGETVQLGTALSPALPAGTVLAYLGDELVNPGNLGTLIAADFANLTADEFSARWEAVSEPWGYVDTANDRISVFNRDNDAGNWVVVTEDTVEYSPRRGTSIGGLDPGTYVVVALPDNPDTAVDESHYIKLARTEQQAIDAYAWEAAGNTGVNPFVINLTPGAVPNTRIFNAGNVNPDDDTITLPGVGNTFELGQAVIYREAGRTDADKVVDGPDGFKIWQSPNAAIDGTPYIPRIEGLEHGGLYYTMVGVDQFNLIGDQRLVDKQVISLGALENETRGGIARIKIGAPVDPNETGFSISAQHILDSTFLTFGGVSALNAADSASATAGLAAEDANDPAKSDDGGFAWNNSAFDNLFNLAIFKYTSNANAGGANGNASVQIGGALAFSFTDHKVQTLITSTANLDSNDDMELTANITEELKLKAESTTEAQKGKIDPATHLPEDNTSADTSVSVAIIVGIENNDASAIVESGAHLDSMRALRLLSGVTYPFLTRPDEFIPTTAGELSDRITSEGLDFINTYLDGTGGLSSLFNTWARSTTEASKVAVAGSINVLSFNNSAQSIIHTGAFINQDPFYRPDPRFYLQPGDVGYDPDYAPDAEGIHGNDNITHSSNANNVDEHVVSVEATNYMQFMNVTGVFGFHLPSLELSDPLTFLRNGIDDVDMSFDASNGANSGRGGVGGAIFLQFLNNTTHAIVEHGVDLYSGKNSGLNIKAEEAIMGFAFSQAGADAVSVAVGGTFSYFEQNSDILAQLAEGSTIEGGRVDVYAGSLETQINWAGGVAKSQAIGAGIAVAINNTDRQTRAVIGEPDDAEGTADSARPFIIDVEGAVTSRASVAGGIYSFTVAGSSVNKTPDKPSSTANGQTAGKTNQSSTGVGIAAAVAVNHVNDVTQASLSDAAVTADAIDVKANNQNHIVAATGGLAFTKSSSGNGPPTSGNNAAALAGAFSDNEINATTDAFIRDADMTLSGVPLDDLVVATASRRFSLTADTVGDVWSLSAGGGGAVADSGTAVAVAGSVSFNTITGRTRARMFDSELMLESGDEPSDALVRATDSSNIFAIAGGLSLAIAKGGPSGGSTALSFGIAIADNTITTDTEALVESSKLTWANGAAGALTVQASSAGSIKAFSVAGASATALAKQGSGTAVAGAGSGSLNEIHADTTATLRQSTVAAAEAVTVKATNDSEIIAGAGAAALSIANSSTSTAASGAVGASFAINKIGSDDDENLVWAEIDNSQVGAGGDITVAAEMQASIFSLGIGAAGGVSNSTAGSAIGIAGAGSVGLNTIRNNTQARVRNGSALTTKNGSGGAINVSAVDDSWINSTAGASALSIAIAQSTAVAVGLGFSLTVNDIGSTTRAAIENSDVVADGAVTVAADSHARVDSSAFGIAVGVAVSQSAAAVAADATGALSFNTVENVVEATIQNSDLGGTAGVVANGAVTVTAADESVVAASAIAAAASISGTPQSASIAISIGLALAHNRIDKDVTASILNMPELQTGGHDVIVHASDAGTIKVVALAAALSVAIGGTGVGVAGGSAEATNIILARTNAFIANSAIGTAAEQVGKVEIDATSTSKIDAAIIGMAVAAGLGTSGVGVAAAVGIAVARNFIGWDPNGTAVAGYVDVPAHDDTTTLPLTSLVKDTTTVRIVDGALAGDIYRYIGATQDDSDLTQDGKQPYDLRIQQYRDTSQWKQVNIKENAGQVRALIEDSSIHAGGALTIDATATENIHAVVLARAAGVGGGTTVGVALSGAGAYAENKIRTDIKAAIDGDGTGTATDGIFAASARVQARDASSIDAIAGAASLAAGFGATVGVAVSIGLSLGFNEIHNDVQAFIVSADEGVTTSSGGVTISAATQGRHLFNLANLDSLITAANLDDVAKADQDSPDDPDNNPVGVTDPLALKEIVGGDEIVFTTDHGLHTGEGHLQQEWRHQRHRTRQRHLLRH